MRISDWSSDVCSSDLEDDDLLALLLRDNLGRNGQPVGGLQLAAVTGKQHVRQRHAFACLAGHLFNYDLVSGGDAILLAACAHHCEHRSEEHTSELQSLMRISYAVFCLKKKKQIQKLKNNISNKNN